MHQPVNKSLSPDGLTRTHIKGLTLVSSIGLPTADHVTHAIPVLLLHGWGGQITSMQAVAEDLSARGYTTHTLDLPGFGQSELPPLNTDGTAWDVRAYTDAVIAYLDAHSITRAHWIGHSFGGRLAIMVGAEYPDRCDKIVLTDSAGVITPPTLETSLKSIGVQVGKALFKLPGLNRVEAQAQQWAQANLGSADYQVAGALAPILKQVVAQDLLPFAARIQAPTLLIWGDQDVDTPLWHAQALEKAIPDAGLVVFAGANHFAYQQQHARFVNIVDTFFSGA